MGTFFGSDPIRRTTREDIAVPLEGSMDVSVTDAALMGIVLTTTTSSAVGGQRAAIAQVIGLLGLAPERVREAKSWVTPRWRVGLPWGLFLALSGVAMAWAGSRPRGIVAVAIGIYALAGISVGLEIGSQHGPLAPLLSKWSLRATRRAAVLAAAGETDASSAATDLAARLERLSIIAPALTLDMVKGQQAPADVANLLHEACFAGEEDHFQRASLERARPERLWPGVEEDARVSLLIRVHDLQRAWPPRTQYAEELIDELRRWPSNKPLQPTNGG